MNDAQIKHMVDRFLMWRLPKPWNPDNGVSYKRPNYAHAPADHDWPVGTNLFSATETEVMVRHMLDGMPSPMDTEKLRTALERICYVEGINPTAYKIAAEALKN